MEDRKELAVVILNYNHYEQTLSLVGQLQKLGYLLVVVDNASPNDSWKHITEYCRELSNVFIVRAEKNGGYSKGNNIGIRLALQINPKLKYIAIMNPDIEICDPYIFENLCEALDSDVTLASATAQTIYNGVFFNENPCAARLLKKWEMLFADVAYVSRLIPRNYPCLMANEKGIAYVEKLQGCFFLMKREIFEKIGFFDENVFLYFEEDIIACKLKEMGYKQGVLVDERIKHNHEVKDSEMANLEKRKFHNRCMLESKKYYMLKVQGSSRLVWGISYFLDSITRLFKDFYIMVKNYGIVL